MQRRFMTMKWKSMITKKTQEKRIVICHKSASDGGALIMTCGRNEKFQPSAIARRRIIMACAHCRAMDKCCQ
jgi:hypothetical protein